VIVIPVELNVAPSNSPEIEVTPESFTFNVNQGETDNSILSISNIAAIGSLDLSWNIAIAPTEELKSIPSNLDMTNWSQSNTPAAGENFMSSIESRIQEEKTAIKYFTEKSTPKVLLMATHDSANIENARISLVLTGMFNSSDIDILPYPTTLSISDLLPYDVVLTWTNNVFDDPVNIGNVLKQYVDSGGGVVLATYCYSTTWAIQGGILDGNYSPFLPTSGQTVSGVLNMGGLPFPEHPIFDNITDAPSYWTNPNYSNPPLNTGGILLAQDTDGNNVIAENPNGKVVGISVFPSSLNDGNVETSLMFANAIYYVYSDIQWITVTPDTGRVSPGENQEINVMVDATDLESGTYNCNLIINSNSPYADSIIVVPVELNVSPVGISENENNIPVTYNLSQNFPNPFNPETTIKYQLPQASDVKITIYNTMGQKVKELVNKHTQAGYHNVVWDGKSNQGTQVSSGIYFYQINAGDFNKTMKLLLLK